MSIILKADTKRIGLVSITSLALIALGGAIHLSIPESNAIRWFFLIAPLFFSFDGLWSVMRRKIVVSEEGVLLVRSYSKIWIPIAELEAWKIKDNHRDPSLHLLTRSGRRIDEFRIGMLGVSNIGITSAHIASVLAKSGKNIGSFSE
ncbi:MAG: hypothetical protein ACK5EU_02920 [Pseudanabaena sp.]|jgi:hypothetical protein|nr:hypothetical protein [Pseudanabaena sp. M34BS1SP1A06MG]MCA6604465.1 hypothetical protein [Pseudanabaena sp. M007S1SP1A06QC]MCA6624884.1 hypothetical protein [Pseudanabaena sp. M165S2SP1A06QC]